MVNNVFILDNGAYTAKTGMSISAEPRIIPNCIMKAKSERRRAFIGDQVEECRDASGLFYILPFQKGYLMKWDIQKTVWDYIFSKDCLNVNFTDIPLIITEPYFNFQSIKETMTEIFFEEYDCHSLLITNAGDLSCYKYSLENAGTLCCLLVDAGYSFIHIVPYIKGKKYKSGIRRIDVGGKVLTNHLKEIISYRQLHVMDETYVVNQAKEDSCFVSLNFMGDMETARKRGKENTIVRDYILPDYTTVRRGYVVNPNDPESSAGGKEQQTLRLNNERFAIPEILFNPQDIGICEKGICEAIADSIAACPPETQPHLYENIVLTGGCCLFPNFKERVEMDVRSLAPDDYDVKVTLPSKPITYAWHGGVLLSKDPQFSCRLVTKEDYEESGQNVCADKSDED